MIQPPYYSPVINDGAQWTCKECKTHGHSRDMWFIKLPNKITSILHKSCVEQDWLDIATFNPTGMQDHEREHLSKTR